VVMSATRSIGCTRVMARGQAKPVKRGGDKLQVIRAVVMAQWGHRGTFPLQAADITKGVTSAPPAELAALREYGRLVEDRTIPEVKHKTAGHIFALRDLNQVSVGESTSVHRPQH
ncbi:MAG: hypothetical protein ACRD3T_17870, partial [Terriglobia bacterium]